LLDFCESHSHQMRLSIMSAGFWTAWSTLRSTAPCQTVHPSQA